MINWPPSPITEPKTVDVGAPGVGILSTLPNGQYGEMSGTSQATPFVSGVLALVWSEYPTLTYQQVINDVYESVTAVPALKGKTVTGGEVNAAAALQLAAPAVAPPVALNAVSLSGTNSISTIQVTFDQVMDPPSFSLVNATLTTPAGLILNPTSITAVVGSGNKVFNFVFATQVANGTYALALNSNIRNAKGTKLVGGYQQNLVVSHPETYTSTTPLSIPADSTVVSSLAVTSSFIITNATVTLNLTGNYDGALFIYLQSPTGVKVYLANDVGGTGKNFTNTVFADTASTPITSGTAPFTGTFQPETPLAGLNGLQALGTWKLVIEDTIPSTSAQLLSWTLTFNTSGGVISTQSSSSAALSIASVGQVDNISSVAASILPGLRARAAARSTFQGGLRRICRLRCMPSTSCLNRHRPWRDTRLRIWASSPALRRNRRPMCWMRFSTLRSNCWWWRRTLHVVHERSPWRRGERFRWYGGGSVVSESHSGVCISPGGAAP